MTLKRKFNRKKSSKCIVCLFVTIVCALKYNKINRERNQFRQAVFRMINLEKTNLSVCRKMTENNTIFKRGGLFRKRVHIY